MMSVLRHPRWPRQVGKAHYCGHYRANFASGNIAVRLVYIGKVCWQYCRPFCIMKAINILAIFAMITLGEVTQKEMIPLRRIAFGGQGKKAEAHLQCKIAEHNRSASSQCRIALRNRSAIAQCIFADVFAVNFANVATTLVAVIVLTTVMSSLLSTSFWYADLIQMKWKSYD